MDWVTDPVTGFTETFSSIPRIAPPPRGSEIAGASKPAGDGDAGE
jgi:hypothetical protein